MFFKKHILKRSQSATTGEDAVEQGEAKQLSLAMAWWWPQESGTVQ